MDKLDYKREFKELYSPKSTPSVVDVPEMTFIQVDGTGNPNEEGGQYQQALELLYALTYTIKMAPKGGMTPPGYFEYVVPPLEGLWWLGDCADVDFSDKSKYFWTSMIRQPEFVTDEVFKLAAETLAKKKGVDTSKARLVKFSEGLCVQSMHLGPYEDEPTTLAKMKEFMAQNGLATDLNDCRKHHEIYLGDPRKIEPAKRKTVLRYPVKRIN